MDSDSEVSAATKHLFGDDSVLQLQSDFVRGTMAFPDRLDVCPVILDNVELPSEVDLEKQWLNLEKRSDVVLPWENGVWKQIFGNQSRPTDSVQAIFTRPLFAPCPELVESVAEGPSKKLRTTAGAEHWKQVVSSVDAMSWKETQDAKLDTAIKRWYDLVLRFPLGIAVKDQIALLAEVSDQLRVLRDIFATKSPLTLIKRANSLQRYVNFLDDQGLLFPGDEAALYKHFCIERDSGSPPSRLQAVVEALRFTEHVLGVTQLGAELLSKRVIGASKFEVAGPRRQASPFAVKELKVLHSILESESQDIWDRVMAGATLCAVYSRSRWSDLQHAEKMEADPDCWEPQFLEFTVREHKTKRANAWMEGFLPAVAVAVGISDENWARQWIVVRARVGADILHGYPVMPAPGPDGEATQRPISSDEMGRWVRMLLERHGISLDGRKITSHSCKSTLLSYMAKFGCGITTREILGGHVSHLKSVLTYSRDGLAGPLRELEQVLESIRGGKFFPDASRSGRFANACKVELHEKVHQVEADVNLGPMEAEATVDAAPQAVDSDSTSSADSDTDSSLDEGASDKGRVARLVRCPSAPAGTSLVQHSKTKMLHLLAEGYQRVFMCGRQKGEAHKPPQQLRWDSPCCSLCWKAARTKLGPRLVQP